MQKLWGDKTCDCCGRKVVLEHIEVVLLNKDILHYCNDECKNKCGIKKFKQIKYINEYEWDDSKNV